MGKMLDYASGKRVETTATNELIKNFNKLLTVRKDLEQELLSMGSVLKEMHMELVNVEDMIFEIKDKLRSHGIEVNELQ